MWDGHLRRRQVIFLRRLVMDCAAFGAHAAAAFEPDRQIKNQHYSCEDDERRYEPQMQHGCLFASYHGPA